MASKLLAIEKTGKRDALKTIELQIRTKNPNKNKRKNVKKEKLFFTFPYPYMNGRLHLGHAYTLSKLSFLARFYEENNVNVLFPFGFHGSGMPIVACAKKLEYEMKRHGPSDYDKLPTTNQISILKSMGIEDEQLEKFIDPEYWIKYFPEKAKEDLQLLGAPIDFSRSFVTTKINPWYDSFIKWQFNKLKEKGILKYGKRYTIFSKETNQPCLGQDRSVGEEVDPKEYFLVPLKTKYNEDDVLVFVKEKTNVQPSDTIYETGKSNELYKFKINEKTVCSTKFIYDNLSGQMDVQFIEKIETYSPTLVVYVSEVKQFVFENKEKVIKYYEPETDVISRTGEKCVVALTPQWFIDYQANDGYYKNIVREHINNIFKFTTDQQVLVQLNKALDWIKEWPCTRYYGLGTKFLDTEYVIDSLSDSTIYMAYYCVAHLIEQIPVDKLNDQLWDSLFLKRDTFLAANIEYTDLVNEMRNEFEYWYPLDLRCSGKDLVGNHLTMCLINHAFIWGSDYLPKSFTINGYLKLNGEKMAKQTGNFLTLRNAIEKYGSDPVCLTLAESDDLDDGNFEELSANSNVIKLTTEREWIESILSSYDTTESCTNLDLVSKTLFFEEYIKQELNTIIFNCKNFYKDMKFKRVIHEGLNVLASIRDKYRSFCDSQTINYNKEISLKIITTLITIIRPICYHFSEYIIDLFALYKINYDRHEQWTTTEKVYKYRYCMKIYSIVLNKINSSLTKTKHSPKEINVTVPLKYTAEDSLIIEDTFSYLMSSLDKVEYTKRKLEGKDNTQKKLIGPLISFVIDNLREYGAEWYSFNNSEIEFNFLKEWLPDKINDIPINILSIPERTFKISPDDPHVQLVFK